MRTEVLLAALALAGAVAMALPASPAGRLSRVRGRQRPPVVRRLEAAIRGRWMTSRSQRRRRDRVREAVSAVAAELRAGAAPHDSLARALEAANVGSTSRAALRWGGSVPEALRSDATAPGCELLLSVAACWGVAEARGAGLAVALERVVESARAAEEVRTQLQAHLAAPKATARMLALLPAVGLILGVSLGGDPLMWLTSSAIGAACLAAGGLLIMVGLVWTTRISARVERQL